MRKNIINCIVVALFALTLLTGCRTTSESSNVSDQPPYRDLIGKHYIVLKDFYLVQMLGHDSSSLYLCGKNGLPKQLDKNKIGSIINGVKIVGVVPKNTEFTLIKIIKDYLGDNNIRVVILVPGISFSSRFNDVAASILWKVSSGTYDFKFDSDLVKEVQ